MQYGIKNIFRFYNAVEKQNRNLDYVGGNLRTWRLYSDIYHVPAFQIQVDSTIAIGDVTIYLVDASDESETNITSYFTADTDLYVETFTSYNYLIYNRSKNLNSTLTSGTYYLHVDCDGTDYYSEVFCATSLTGKMIVTYSDTNDLASIDYTNGAKAQFENKLIVDTVLQRPDYLIVEEGTEDGEGNFLPTFQRMAKKYRFIFYAPEYVIDAVSLIGFHDTITIVTQYNESATESMDVREGSFHVTPEWNDMKGFAKVTCEFEVTAIIKTNCANDIS